MARNSLRQWSTTAASNTDIAGISLAEGVTKPSDVNDFERAHMGQMAQYLAEMSFPTVGGTSDALTLTPTTALAALASNVVYTGTILSANATQTPTLNVSGLGAKVIRKISGNTDVALSVGDLPTGGLATFVYSTAANSSGGAWLLTNPVVSVFPVGPLTNLASASTTDLGTIGSHNINITGTTTITAFGSSAATGQPKYKIKFAGILTLTYNATSMILQGNDNIVTAAGDTADADYLGSGNWTISNYIRAAVAPNTGAGISGGFRNLVLTVATNTTGTITADGMTLLNITTGNPVYLSGVSLSNNNAVNGANGLDTGAIATSTWYAVYVIYNPTTQTTASLISLSFTNATFPSGYTYSLRVGAWYNAAAGGYRRTLQKGRSATIVFGTNPTTALNIANGTAGTYGSSSPTLVSASLASFVPPTASAVFVAASESWKGLVSASVIVAPSMAFSGSQNGPQGSNGLLPAIWMLNGSTSFYVRIQLESAALFWCSDASGGALLANGWEDNL